jgi:hypothetical protein
LLEIRATGKKLHTLHWDNRKDTLSAFQEFTRCIIRSRYEIATHLKDFHLINEHFLGTLMQQDHIGSCLSRIHFPVLSPSGTSQGAGAVIQEDPATAQASGRSWCPSHDAGYGGIQNTIVAESWRLPLRFQRKA